MRAYAFGDTLVGTIYYQNTVMDFKINMDSSGMSATGRVWYVGHKNGRQERDIIFTKELDRPDDGSSPPATAISWNQTAVSYAFTGTWDMKSILLPNLVNGDPSQEYLDVTIKTEQKDLAVTGIINGNPANIIEGMVVGRNLYAAVRFNGVYGHFWALISADGKTVRTHSGIAGVSGGGGTGERSPAPNLSTASTWAQDSVTIAYAYDLIPSALQNTYSANATRAEFATLAVALYEVATGKEITERVTFSDTNDVNVEKAAAIGVLTREQAAVMLARLANAAAKPLPKQAATFGDNGSISSWAVEAVGQVQAAEIMGGVGNNMFSPQGAYTKEQSIITILRLFNFVKQ
jgi:hypothetical protein